MNMVLYLGLILLAGFTAGKLINYVKLPAVTGYLVIGLLLGPSLLGLVTSETITALTPINTIALSIIAFTIGGEFAIKQLKKVGKSVILIAILEVVGAFAFVTLTLHFLLGVDLYIALIFGAISSATAPAATIMVLRQYKARGPLTDTLLAVVAIDDALCVIAFGITMAISKVLAGEVSGSLATMIGAPFWELFGSFLLGTIAALVLLTISTRLKEQPDRIVIILGMVLATAGLAEMLNLSTLLACMAMGCISVNLLPRETGRIFDILKSVDTPIYVLFFVLAGANLQLELVTQVGAIGVAYIVSRVIGKMAGAALGAKLGGAPETVLKYLGLGLVPQAGVAIGVTLVVQQNFPSIADLVTTVILGSVVVYEIIGPFCSKLAITRAGEVGKAESQSLLTQSAE
ncbi:MAG: cation:proton antiporter [Bacillota bacterium]